MISEFRRRENRRGATYVEELRTSWRRLLERVRELYPKADEKDILRLVGRGPGD